MYLLGFHKTVDAQNLLMHPNQETENQESLVY